MYVWLDLQRMGYGFGNGSLWSLAVLVLRPTEPSPLASLRPAELRLRMAALDIFVQQEGVVLAISGRHGHIIRLASYATPGYGESPERYSVFLPQPRFRPGGGCAGVRPAFGNGGEANGRNFRRRRSSLPSVLSSTAAAAS